jgi:hypothetical protein
MKNAFCFLILTIYQLALATTFAWARHDSLTIINEQSLGDRIRNSKKPFVWLIFMTSRCGGTPYALRYINNVGSKYGDKVDIIPVFSDFHKNRESVHEILRVHKIPYPAFLISGEIPGHWLDARKRGFNLRNMLCEPCRADIIGVPYHLVFDSSRKVVLHGYPGSARYSPGIPEDFFPSLLATN